MIECQDEDEASDPPNTAEVAAMSAGGRVGGAAAGSHAKDRLVEEPLAVLLAGVLHQVRDDAVICCTQ